MKSTEVLNAERRSEIAMAKLGVVEELRWAIATPLALLIYIRWDTIIGGLVSFAIAFYWVTRGYDKEYEAANDALEQLTGTGKHFVPPPT